MRSATTGSNTNVGKETNEAKNLDRNNVRVYKPASSISRQKKEAKQEAEELSKTTGAQQLQQQRENQERRGRQLQQYKERQQWSSSSSYKGAWGNSVSAPGSGIGASYRGKPEDTEYDVQYTPPENERDAAYYQNQYGLGEVYSVSHEAVDAFYGVSPHEREAAMMDHILELEREVLHLRAVVKQMEEQHVPQIDDLRNRMDVVMQVLWNTGAVG